MSGRVKRSGEGERPDRYAAAFRLRSMQLSPPAEQEGEAPTPKTRARPELSG